MDSVFVCVSNAKLTFTAAPAALVSTTFDALKFWLISSEKTIFRNVGSLSEGVTQSQDTTLGRVWSLLNEYERDRIVSP